MFTDLKFVRLFSTISWFLMKIAWAKVFKHRTCKTSVWFQTTNWNWYFWKVFSKITVHNEKFYLEKSYRQDLVISLIVTYYAVNPERRESSEDYIFIYPVTDKLSDTEKLPPPLQKCNFIEASLNFVTRKSLCSEVFLKNGPTTKVPPHQKVQVYNPIA